MTRWVYIIMPVLAAAALAVAVATRPAPPRSSPAAIDASVLFSLDEEYIALKRLENRYHAAVLEMELETPGGGGPARERAAVLTGEWRAFGDGIRRRIAAVESIIRENSMNEAGSAYFRLKADFATRRNEALAGADRDLLAAYDASSGYAYPPGPEDDRRALLHVRLNLKVLTRDNLVMPDYRLAELTAREAELAAGAERREREYLEKNREDFSRESAGISERLAGERRTIGKELDLAVSEVVARAGRSVESAAVEHRKVSESAAAEGAGRRVAMYARRAPDGEITRAAERPAPDFKEIESLLKYEYVRRLSRKAPAFAERNGNYVIFNTPFPGAGKVRDVTEEFREDLDMKE